ncbi:MAG TPA: DUF2202 domain-containing protein [Micromonosporaceae bacterium]
MNRTTRLVTVLATVGMLGLGGLAVTSPVAAGALTGVSATLWNAGDPGPGHDEPTGRGHGPGQDGGHGQEAGRGPQGKHGGKGDRAGDHGDCASARITEETGVLSEQQRATLTLMAEEEKLARDLYAAFAAEYQVPVFDRIKASEERHLALVRTLLDRYGLADPTDGLVVGEFRDPTVQAHYDRLLAQGSASRRDAIEAALAVERMDIDDLTRALDGLTAPDVRQVYEHLLDASERHLAAFERWSNR